MATYNPASLGVKAPSTGFQQGGWYNGRQYWAGTLSEPGQIHPSSNQQGAGQDVSKEVNAQTSVAAGLTPNANQDYIDAQKRAAAAKPVAPTPVAMPASAPTSAGMTGAGGSTGGSIGGMGTQATLNLPDLYKTIYSSSGISDLEKQYSDMESQFTETKGKINDNPFLSEATRVGRVAKLESLYNERTANIKNDIATKKADIETKLNLETKQFDINSQAAKQALDQFNTLLSMGALSGATGEDIAAITRSTGISSSAIMEAVNASKKSNVKTSVINSTADDGTVTATVINTQTGELINQTNLGKVGNAQQGRAPSATDTKMQYINMFKEDAAKGLTLQNAFSLYGGILDPNDIYNLYNSSSMFGPAKESPDQLAKFGVKPITTPINQYPY